jgi:Bacterial Ig-like domain (group 2)
MCKVRSIRASFLLSTVFTLGCSGVSTRFSELNVKHAFVRVSISPVSATVQVGKTQQFVGSVTGTSDNLVSWSATNGTISCNGLFTASGSPGSASVTATSVADTSKSASALLSVNEPPAISLNVTPSTATILVGQSQQFSATVFNAENGSVTWSSTGVGSVSDNGLYVASLPGTSSVMATSVEDPTKFGAAQIVVNPSQSGSFDGPAELPRITLDTLLADTPSPGIVTIVTAEGNVQASINAASCGDTIELQAGASYSGAFTLPAKACDDAHWIVIRTSAPDSALPPEGTRINPCYAGVASLPGRPAFSCPSSGVMAQVIAPKSIAAFTLTAEANHYRLGPGLEITRAIGTGLNYGLILPSGAADHIIVDRDWIHGTAQDDTTRGVFLSGVTYAAVVDSYLNDFHCTAGIGACSDAQAISGGTGQLPQGTWKINGNFLEASTENILFGGVLRNSTTPTDIEIRFNHLFKPLIWMPGQPGFVGGKETATLTCPKWDPTGTIGQCPFVVKNLFELKNAQRVLFEGNVLDYTWPGFTQHGNAVLLSGLNPPGFYSSISVADVTIRYNRIAHATSGFVVANMATNSIPNLPVTRISVHDDVFDDLSPAFANGDTSITAALPFQLNSCSACIPLQDISINHVTMLLQAPKIGLILGATAPDLLQGFSFTNNIVSLVPALAITGVGPAGPCGFNGTTELARLNSCFAVPYSFVANALIGATGTWPAGNFFPSDAIAIQFTDYNGGNGGDYHLLPTSLYKNAATDGQDLGANVDTVLSAIDGVQ